MVVPILVPLYIIREYKGQMMWAYLSRAGFYWLWKKIDELHYVYLYLLPGWENLDFFSLQVWQDLKRICLSAIMVAILLSSAWDHHFIGGICHKFDSITNTNSGCSLNMCTWRNWSPPRLRKLWFLFLVWEELKRFLSVYVCFGFVLKEL